MPKTASGAGPVPYKEINSQLDSGARSGKIGQEFKRKVGGNPTSGGKITKMGGKSSSGRSNSY